MYARKDQMRVRNLIFFCTYCLITKNTLISVECQPPVGYNQVASVGKYYKSSNDMVTWQIAKDRCSSEGGTLVELRTKEEYEAIRPIFGKIMFYFK